MCPNPFTQPESSCSASPNPKLSTDGYDEVSEDGSPTQLPTVRAQTSLVVLHKNVHNFDFDAAASIKLLYAVYGLSFVLHALVKYGRNLHSAGIDH